MKKKHLMMVVLVSVLVLSVAGFVNGVTGSYDVDYSEPSSVVENAIAMVLNKDYEAMLEVTADGQKEKTQEIIDELETNSSFEDELEDTFSRVVDYDIIQADIFTNENIYYSIVNTRWVMEFSGIQPTTGVTIIQENERDFDLVFVDYLLREYNGSWYIISQKNK